MACTSDECNNLIGVVSGQKKRKYIVRCHDGTESDASHPELAPLVSRGEREDDDIVMVEAVGGLKKDDCQLGLTGRFVAGPKMS